MPACVWYSRLQCQTRPDHADLRSQGSVDTSLSGAATTHCPWHGWTTTNNYHDHCQSYFPVWSIADTDQLGSAVRVFCSFLFFISAAISDRLQFSLSLSECFSFTITRARNTSRALTQYLRLKVSVVCKCVLCVATQLSIGQKSLLYFTANQCSSGTSQMETRTVLKSTDSLAIVFPLQRLN